MGDDLASHYATLWSGLVFSAHKIAIRITIFVTYKFYVLDVLLL